MSKALIWQAGAIVAVATIAVSMRASNISARLKPSRLRQVALLIAFGIGAWILESSPQLIPACEAGLNRCIQTIETDLQGSP